MLDETSDNDTGGSHRCPSCGSSEHVVPVWSVMQDFMRGEDPDYVGCEECREMIEQ